MMIFWSDQEIKKIAPTQRQGRECWPPSDVLTVTLSGHVQSEVRDPVVHEILELGNIRTIPKFHA